MTVMDGYGDENVVLIINELFENRRCQRSIFPFSSQDHGLTVLISTAQLLLVFPLRLILSSAFSPPLQLTSATDISGIFSLL